MSGNGRKDIITEGCWLPSNVLKSGGKTSIFIFLLVLNVIKKHNDTLSSAERGSLPPAYVVRGKVLFSQMSVCSHLWRGGEVTASSWWGGGGIHPADGGSTPSQVWMGGYPLPRSGWGVPLPRSGWGVPPIQVRSQDGGYPLLKQHSMYLLRSGRRASCVHGGGLSCFICIDRCRV